MAFTQQLSSAFSTHTEFSERLLFRLALSHYISVIMPTVINGAIRSNPTIMIRLMDWAGIRHARDVYSRYQWMIRYALNPQTARLAEKFQSQTERLVWDVVPDSEGSLRDLIIRKVRAALAPYLSLLQSGEMPEAAYGILR